MTLSNIRTLAQSVGTAIAYYATGSYIALAEFGAGIPAIPGTPGGSTVDEGKLRELILKALTFVLNFLALVAVVFIVVAGIRLIVSQGDEDAKNKAKTTILYVILGLLVILFARVIVGFFTTGVADTFSALGSTLIG
jgi:Type IV secretion system pilin